MREKWDRQTGDCTYGARTIRIALGNKKVSRHPENACSSLRKQAVPSSRVIRKKNHMCIPLQKIFDMQPDV